MNNQEKDKFIKILEKRFNENTKRHPNTLWKDVVVLLEDSTLLNTLLMMEETGGQIDVFEYESSIYYADFSKETPINRRSFCYDKEALDKRKQNKPLNDAHTFAKQMGADILDEAMYKYIQSIEQLDLKTSSWIKTPNNIRSLGGALFGDNRYDNVFIYHNGADSYYSSRGFRCFIKVK